MQRLFARVSTSIERDLDANADDDATRSRDDADDNRNALLPGALRRVVFFGRHETRKGLAVFLV